jgi:hypothetical protein
MRLPHPLPGRLLLCLFLFASLGIAGRDRTAAADLEAGFAAVEITPPVGWRKAGGFNEVISTDVHDPLFAKAAVFRQGDTSAVLVVCDLISVPEFLTTPTRRDINQQTRIPTANIVICATHTHGGPEFHGPMRNLFHERALAEKGRDEHEPLDYVALLRERIARAVVAARKNLTPARLEIVRARQEGLAFNRRFHMKDGTVRFNPGKGNPDIERPAGPTDPDLPFLLFRRASDGRPFASLTVFAMHVAAFGGTEIGADYPAHLARRLEQHFGPGFFSLFGQGTAGDVNHFNVATRAPDPSPEAIGARLADTILAKLPEAVAVRAPALAVASEVVEAPLYELTPEQVEHARTIMARTDRKPIDFLLHVDAWRVLHNDTFRRRFGDALPNEVQVIRLGADTALVTLPHEIFVELGLAIKKRSPFANTLVLSMAQDVDFYVPTRRAYAEGGYEVVTTPLKPGVGEALVESAVRLLGKVSPSGATGRRKE